MNEIAISEWPQTTIKKSTYLRGRIGWQGLRASEFTEEGPFLITGTDFSDGQIDWSNCYHVSERRFAEAAYIHVRNGDLLVTKDGTIGKVAYVTGCPDRAVLNSGVFLLRCADGSFDHRWLYHILRSSHFDRFLRLNLNGSTINHLYQYVFERYEFPTPDRIIQAHVSDVLGTIEASIRLTESLIAKYQQIKAGLMHDLFTRGVTADGKLRPPREQAPDLYHETLIGWIPKEWGWSRCGDICENVCVGIVIRPAQYYVETGVPTFRSANIRESGIDASDLVFISNHSNALLAKSQVRAGDVLTVRTGYPGTSAVVPPEFDGSNCVDILISRPGKSIDSHFLCNWINSPFGKDQVLTGQGGLAQQHFNVGEMRSLVVALPDQLEQQRIVGELQAVSSRIDAEKALLEKTQALKHGLMHDLLTGHMHVKVA